MNKHSKFIGLTLVGLLCLFTLGSDYHQQDQGHTVVTTHLDSSGNHVTGATFRLTVRSQDNVNYYDFNNSTWGTFGTLTTPHQTMHEDSLGGFYWYPFSGDGARLVSGDYVFIISSDTVGVNSDDVVTVIHFDSINQLIRIQR